MIKHLLTFSTIIWVGLCAQAYSDETTVHQKPNSLRDIYELGYEEGFKNNDLNILVSEHLKECCLSYDQVIYELKSAGFEDIKDVTEPAKSNTQKRNTGDTIFDLKIASRFRAYGKLITFYPSFRVFYSTEYYIGVYFQNEQIVRVEAAIYTDSL